MTSLTTSRKTKPAAGGIARRIVPPAAGDGYVHYDIAQDLTATETAQARSNIDVLVVCAEYDTLTDMKAANATDFDMIYIHGYAAPGDGGAGFYKRLSGTPDPIGVGNVQQGNQWWEFVVPATGLDPRAVGVTFSGKQSDAVNETTAWNSLITKGINNGTVSKLVLPPLTSIIDASLNEITASNWTIQGAVYGESVIKMSSVHAYL